MTELEYAVPIVPVLGVGGVIEIDGLPMKRENTRVMVADRLSVTFIAKVKSPTAVGVPAMIPVVASTANPGGREPDATMYA